MIAVEDGVSFRGNENVLILTDDGHITLNILFKNH